MKAQKISISLPEPVYDFLARYQTIHRMETRSEVIVQALKLLHQSELESAYQEANAEIETDWDRTAGEGLDDETW